MSHQSDFDKFRGPLGWIFVNKTTGEAYKLERYHWGGDGDGGNLHKLSNLERDIFVTFQASPGFGAHGVAIKIISRWEGGDLVTGEVKPKEEE